MSIHSAAIPGKHDKRQSLSYRRAFLAAARPLFSAWVTYALLECVFAVILPFFSEPRHLFIPVHWAFLTSSLIVYLLFAFILSLLTGVWLRHAAEQTLMWPSLLLPKLGSLSLVITYSLNIMIQFPLNRTYPWAVLILSLVLIAMVILSARSEVMAQILRHYTNPYFVLCTLLGFTWINCEIMAAHSTTAKAIAFGFYLAALSLVSFLSPKIGGKATMIHSFSDGVRGRAIYDVSMGIALLIICVIAVQLRPIPLALVSPYKHRLMDKAFPNIILVTMDTVRADHMSMYGYERDTTPNLRRFAEMATNYTRAVAPGNFTLTTHASIFTGMYAGRHGAYWTDECPEGAPLNRQLTTVTEILAREGYATLGVVSNSVFLSSSFGLDKGFEYYDQRRRRGFIINRTNYYYLSNVVYRILHLLPLPRVWGLFFRRAEEVNSVAFELLERIGKERRSFFLFVNYMDAHDPYVPPPPYDRFFPGKDEKSISMRDLESLWERVRGMKGNVSAEERRHLSSQYDGGIAYMDLCIGKLIERLKEMDLYDNSLIIITSDHGEAFGERYLIKHGTSVYQDQVHVPLIIAYPGVKDAKTVRVEVSLTDLLPTILDVAGIGDGEERARQGISLTRTDIYEQRGVVSESYPAPQWRTMCPRLFQVERAIFVGWKKLITSDSGKRELFDLAKDPDERINLYQSNAPVARELENRLENWIKTSVAKVKPKGRTDRDALERLKSLGYVK